MKGLMTVVAMVALIAVLVVAGPLLLIWSINEFGQYLWPDRVIPYTVWTWFAALILGAVFNPTLRVTRKR
jgi:hypothetical protein